MWWPALELTVSILFPAGSPFREGEGAFIFKTESIYFNVLFATYIEWMSGHVSSPELAYAVFVKAAGASSVRTSNDKLLKYMYLLSHYTIPLYTALIYRTSSSRFLTFQALLQHSVFASLVSYDAIILLLLCFYWLSFGKCTCIISFLLFVSLSFCAFLILLKFHLI